MFNRFRKKAVLLFMRCADESADSPAGVDLRRPVCAMISDMKTFNSSSLEETRNVAKEWLADISSKYSDFDEALVVGLSGHLGAGKTAFVKLIAKELGMKEEVTSPTFVIMKIYEINDQASSINDKKQKIIIPWKRLVHIDAYRLERREELEVLQWEQLVADKNNLILIEWPDNVGLKEFRELANLKFEAGEGKYKITVE